MNDIVKSYQERFRRSRHTFRRYAAFLLALAMITTLFVNWQLHGVGISMTAEYLCGEQEHTHTADCYTKMLVCGYNEGELENPDAVVTEPSTDDSTGDSGIALYSAEPVTLEPQIEWVPHEHTDECYTEVQTLTCLEEEHVHDDDCFDPEDGSLICDKFEHTHDESCYTTEYELTCGLEDGELVEQVVEPTESAALFEMAAAAPVAVALPVDTGEELVYHHHTDDCYEEVLTCPFPEHHHTVNCFSDTLADLEPASAPDVTLEGFWSKDLIDVAMTQLGYEQSEKNFKLDTEDHTTVRHYTRYGQAYGNPYGEWDVMFLSYCLNYAEIPEAIVPRTASALALRGAMKGMEWLLDEDGTAAAPGGIVLYKKTATYTVAVEPEEDTTSDDLTDLTSLYTENSADADDYGIATLPAIVDETTKPVVVDDDFTVPSITLPESEPQTTTKTATVETVGIVTDIDEEAGTLTVISGDVDGKVDYVTLAMSDISGVVSIASAQMAYESGAAVQPGQDTTKSTVTYIDTFNELDKNFSQGGITSITVKQGNKPLNPGDSINLTSGEKLSLTYNFSFPENALSNLTNRTLTYHLPDGITLSESKELQLKNDNDNGKEVGTVTVAPDGTVTIVFDESYNINEPFTGKLDFDVIASTVGDNDSSTIHFPTDLDITVKKRTDLSIKKDASAPYVDANGDIYIDYTVVVSSKEGWSDPIEILDQLNKNDSASGEYVKNSFALCKIDSNGTKTSISSYDMAYETVTSTDDSFHITDLDGLKAGERYELTYKVKITKIKRDDGSFEFQNAARSNNVNDWTWGYSKGDSRIWKNGSYDPDTNEITWTVCVKNPYGQDLKDAKVTDSITTDGATIKGNITLTETKDSNGNDVTNIIDDSIPPYSNNRGFEYTFGAGSNGKEYKFTYKTTVPTDSNGDPVKKVHNDSTFNIGGKDYSAGKDVKPSDRKWGFNKSAVDNNLTSTGENQYIAKWKISSSVPNSWTSYTFVDQIKVPDKGNHYGIASELDSEICNNMIFTTVDGQVLTAAQAGIDVDIKYYAESFSDKKDPDKYGYTPISAKDDSDTEIHTFIITLTYNGNYDSTIYDGTSPVKSMDITNYYTHVDTTAVPEGSSVSFYNNDSSYWYKKDAPKKSLTKGVSTNKGDSSYRNGYESSIPDAKYTGDGKGIFYQLILDVSSWTEFPEDGTITVTDTLPDGLEYKSSNTAAYFGWGGYAGSLINEPDSNHNQIFHDLTLPDNFTATLGKDGKTITFTFKNLKELDYQLQKNPSNRLTDLVIRYSATVKDPDWDRPQTVSKTYVNKAMWGENQADASITLNKDFDYLKKSANVEDVVDSKGNKTGEHIIHYTLNINPTYSDLLPGEDYVTLTDVLTVDDDYVTVHLDMDSVKLYDYPYKEGAQPLDTTSYELTYTTKKNGNHDEHTMTFKLQDSHGYVLKYDYVLDSDSTVKISNKASLSGDHNADSNATITRVDGSASVSKSQVTLYKVDSLNPLTRLQGAKFKLSSYNGTDFVDHPQQATHVTDVNGKIVIYLGQNQKDDSSNEFFDISSHVLYRLEETDPPKGYAKDSKSVVYFVFADAGDATAEAVLNAITIPAGVSSDDIVVCLNGQHKDISYRILVPG